jgi:hypothetical protein
MTSFTEHKDHTNYYPFCTVSYWAVDANGMHASKPTQSVQVIRVETRNGAYTTQLDFGANKAHEAEICVRMLHNAYIRGGSDAKEEIRKVLGV